MKETVKQRAARLEQARHAAADALFDKYERWNDRGFLADTKKFRCSTHDDEQCRVCHPTKNRKNRT